MVIAGHINIHKNLSLNSTMETHIMKDGTLHTGAKHTASSEVVKLMKIIPAKAKGKKWTAYFSVGKDKEKAVSFGAAGYRDYTLVSDPKSKFYLKSKAERDKVKAAYIARHSKEDQSSPLSPAALSRFVLWQSPNFGGAINAFKKRFGV